MCIGGGGDSTASRLAQQQAQAEQERQDRINAGMQQIQAMFEGGQAPSGQVAAGTAYDPSKTYYTAGGQAWQPGNVDDYMRNNATKYTIDAAQYSPAAATAYGPTGNYASMEGRIGANEGQLQQQQDVASQQGYQDWYAQQQAAMKQKALGDMFSDQAAKGALYSGVTQQTGYGDDFFNKAYQAQLDYAMPQVDKQYADAQRQLQYALARQGLISSTVANTQRANLEGERDQAVQAQQDTANQVRNQQRQAVESERSSLTNLLQSTGDVASTMNAAQAGKSIIEAAPAIQEVAPLFQNATGALADTLISPAIRQQTLNSLTGTGGFGSGKSSSGRVVN